MSRKTISDGGQLWNMVEIYRRKENSKMISSGWREKGHGMFVNNETLLEFMILREILKWSHLYEEDSYIGWWLMMKHCLNCSC